MAAFSYANPEAIRQMASNDVPLISEYALGSDYHTVLRKSMTALGERITADFGGAYRVCIDTAPLRERYWAQQAGLGFIGRNNYLIIPGHGAHFFLAALLWTGTPVDGYDEPCALTCGDCGKCREACPTGALKPDGGCDTRRCLSYLTIECREPLPDGLNARNNLFGCDICRNACPHQSPLRPATDIPDFTARQEILSLSFDDWAEMTQQRYNTLFKDSAVKRAKLPKLKANASLLANKKS